jgi:hypothetical protein
MRAAAKRSITAAEDERWQSTHEKSVSFEYAGAKKSEPMVICGVRIGTIGFE